jgi:hypothetical protein
MVNDFYKGILVIHTALALGNVSEQCFDWMKTETCKRPPKAIIPEDYNCNLHRNVRKLDIRCSSVRKAEVTNYAAGADNKD